MANGQALLTVDMKEEEALNVLREGHERKINRKWWNKQK